MDFSAEERPQCCAARYVTICAFSILRQPFHSNLPPFLVKFQGGHTGRRQGGTDVFGGQRAAELLRTSILVPATAAGEAARHSSPQHRAAASLTWVCPGPGEQNTHIFLRSRESPAELPHRLHRPRHC